MRLKSRPRPWSVYDPNGDYMKLTGHKLGYRPIWMRDANGKDIFYIGNGGDSLQVAEFIVALTEGEVTK